MAKLLKLRRGTTTQHGSFTGAEGEVTVDTDKETLVVHDGSTAGGHPVAAEDMANVSSASIAGRLSNDSIATSKIAAGALPSDVTVENANVTSSAAIAGTKISPDFGSQNVTTTGNVGIGSGSGTSFPLHVVGSGNTTVLRVESTDDDANVGPILELFRNSASAADNDALGRIDFRADDESGNESTFARIGVTALDVTNATEDAKIEFTAVANDTFTPSFSITGSGVDVTGNIAATGNIRATGNGSTMSVGDNNDLFITHSNNGLIDCNTGDLTIQTQNAMQLKTADAEFGIQLVKHGGVQLYHDNTGPKLETTSGGVSVTGNITVSGTVDGRDVATDGTKLDGITANAIADLVEDTSPQLGGNLDTNGKVITFGDSSGGTDDRLKFGNSDDFQIYHNGTNSVLDNDTGALSIQTTSNLEFEVQSNFRVLTKGGSENCITGTTDGAVDLYYDSSKKFETTSYGGKITGQLYADGGRFGKDDGDYLEFTTDTRADIVINGNNEFRFESDGDFHADGDVIAQSTTISSDAKLKEDIELVPDALDKLNKLNGVTFKWKRSNEKSAGVIAQDVQKVLPEAVKEVTALSNGESHLSVNYHALTSILIEAVKELQAEVEKLKGGK